MYILLFQISGRLKDFRLPSAFTNALLLYFIILKCKKEQLFSSSTPVCKTSENRVDSQMYSAGMEDGEGLRSRGLVKLKVPDTDVRAGGTLV